MEIAALPIDRPRVNVSDRIFDFVDPNVSINSQGHYQHKYSEIFWNSYSVRHNHQSLDQGEMSFLRRYQKTEWMWDHCFSSEFSYLIEFLESLPFEVITYATLHQNCFEVAPHKDFYQDQACPVGLSDYHKYLDGVSDCCLYRVLLKGTSDTGIYLSRTKEGERKFIHLPEDTNTFVYSHRRMFHGALLPPNKKVLCQLYGYLDVTKHEKLLKQSLKKFPDYVIEFN